MACQRCGMSLSDAPTVPLGSPPTESYDDIGRELGEELQGAYNILRPIAAGGMSIVFLARDPALRRYVAVKVLRPALAADPEATARFEREMRVIALLTHPHIVPIYARGQLGDERPYFVMQYAEGGSLETRTRAGETLPQEEARKIIGQIASALALAHRHGVVHRDIKPSNILFDSESGRALVADFGISALRGPLTSGPVESLTGSGVLIGTPKYMSPEQLLAAEVTDRTDVYALGLLAFELLTKQPAFEGATIQALIAAHLRDAPPQVSSLRPEVDPELEALITQSLSKSPQERPSAASLAERLLPRGTALLEWPPPGIGVPLGGLRKAAAWFWAGSAAVLLPSLIPALSIGGVERAVALSSGFTNYLVATVGIGALTIGLARTVQAVWVLIRARIRGYSAATSLEVLADVRSDTGHIITASREYAALTQPRRRILRTARMAREVCLLLAGSLPIPFYIACVKMAGPPGARAILAAGLLTFCVLLPLVLGSLEARLTVGTRERLSRAKIASPRHGLAEAWAATAMTFQGRPPRVTGGQGAILATLLLGASGLIAVVAGLFTLPILYIGAFGSAVWSLHSWAVGGIPDYPAALYRSREFVVPASDSISALSAGEAEYALVSGFGTEMYRGSSHFYERQLTLRPYEHWPSGGEPGIFLDIHSDSSARVEHATTIPTRALAPDDLKFLHALAAHPLWQVFDRVALAREVDYLGARFRLPLPDTSSWWAFPPVQWAGTTRLALYNRARVKYYLAVGDSAEAIASARMVIGFGFKLVDGGFRVADFIRGREMVQEGGAQLLSVYRALKHPDTDQLEYAVRIAHANADPSVRSAGPNSFLRRSPSREALIALATSPGVPRSLRGEALGGLSLAACTNIPELLFGLDDDIKRSFVIARSMWGGVPADTEALKMIGEAASNVNTELVRVGGRPGGTSAFWMQNLADMVTRATGNSRISGCLRVVQYATESPE